MNDAPPLPVEKKKRGCWLIGCSVLLVVVLVFSAIAGFIVWKGMNAVQPYLASAPLQIEPSTSSEADFQALQERLAAFTAVGPGAPTELTLTPADWNTLIAHRPDWANAKEHVKVFIEGDDFSVQSSIPYPLSDGKFLNGRIHLKPAIADGRLVLPIENIVVEEKALPPDSQKVFGEALRSGFEDLLGEDRVLKPVIAKATKLTVENDATVFRSGP